MPEDDDIIVRERVRTRRSVVLLVDVSGSMRGERVRTAAATVGALAGELSRDDLAVVAFWSDAAVLAGSGSAFAPQTLLDTLLRIPAQGLTNVAFPLQVAARELARVPARDARVLLLSDCVHNAGPDPRPFAARLPRLDVLLDTSGEQDVELARELARLGHGRLRPIRGLPRRRARPERDLRLLNKPPYCLRSPRVRRRRRHHRPAARAPRRGYRHHHRDRGQGARGGRLRAVCPAPGR